IDDGPRDVTVARVDGFGETPEPVAPARAPLGFVDVRADMAQADEIPAGEPSVESPVDAVASADQGSGENVPFYKREISFGRKKPAEAPAAVELSPADEADSDETVPFYKREISFRRPSDSPQDELAPVEDDHVEAIAAADPVEETHEEAPVHDAQAAEPV